MFSCQRPKTNRTELQPGKVSSIQSLVELTNRWICTVNSSVSYIDTSCQKAKQDLSVVQEYIPKICSHLSSSERIIFAFPFILNSEDTLAMTYSQTIIQWFYDTKGLMNNQSHVSTVIQVAPSALLLLQTIKITFRSIGFLKWPLVFMQHNQTNSIHSFVGRIDFLEAF
jgi:hypothetical protein